MQGIPIIENPEKTEWAALLARPVIQAEDLEVPVRGMLSEIKSRGDLAVDGYAAQFDGIQGVEKLVQPIEFLNAQGKLDTGLKDAIRNAMENILAFHRRQQIVEPVVEINNGIWCWRKSVAIEKVGLYIPGGTAPLFSTLLMLGVPAVLAGCKEIVVCTPPQKDGSVHPAILYTAQLAGLKKILRIGGVQAIGAMAYGTATVPKVYKIFGPGNQWVTQAKKIVQQEGVSIDMPAGPSELAVLADETAVPAYVAADLLSQCEHGEDSQTILVTGQREFADKVNEELEKQVQKLPRRPIAEKALQNSRIFVFTDQSASMELLNEYAPEHLILACKNAESIAGQVVNAGSVFIGNFAPESAGDYASGTNHVLPTNGFAKSYSGVSMDSFVKKITFQQLSREGLTGIGDTVVKMADAEGLRAHAAAIEIRIGPDSKTEKL